MIILIIAAMMPFMGITASAEAASAIKTDSIFYVDETHVSFRSYTIDDSIYVCIFELAIALSGSEKQFSLAWSAGGQALRIISQRPYMAIGVSRTYTYPATANAALTGITVLLDGEETDLTSYKIGNDIYFNLKQFAKALDFNVVTQTDLSTVELITDTPHKEDTINYGRNIDPSLPMVALTYDDGPVRYTSSILDILEEYGVVATFYVIGSQVEREKDTILRMVELGNEIGNHTMNHRNLRRLTYGGVQSQLREANNAVEKITGIVPYTMRPPWGETGSTSRDAVAELGMPIMLWSVDPQDWLTKNAYTTYNRVMERVKDGDVILLHDTHESTIRATAMLIPALLERGYQLVTVSELFYYKDVDPVMGRVYGAIR